MSRTKVADVTIGRWRFKRIDSMNWQVFEFKEVERGENKGETKWIALQSYFGSLLPAIVYARNREFERGGFVGDIDGAIKEFERIDAKFEKDLRKALKEVAR